MNGKFAEISALITQGCILKKINVSVIINFCLHKYSFSADTF